MPDYRHPNHSCPVPLDRTLLRLSGYRTHKTVDVEEPPSVSGASVYATVALPQLPFWAGRYIAASTHFTDTG